MARARRHWDDSDVKIRARGRSRPRTKDRPRYQDAKFGMVVTKDRGRWGVVLDSADSADHRVVCVRARQLGRTSIEVGDRVGIVGDTSGRPGTLGRIVIVQERRSVLRRTADDNDPYERIVVANADTLLIVCAVADPPPRTGFVERSLIAAFVGGLQPVLCLTKSDLADPQDFAGEFHDLAIPVVTCGIGDDLGPLMELTHQKVCCLIGHSGVGKSTLVNRLIPDAHRATGEVSGVGKGRHTSTQSVAIPFNDGWIIDTPGIRSFGLAHVDAEVVLRVFDDLHEAIQQCPRGCSHLGPPADPECGLDTINPDSPSGRRVRAVRRLLVSLRSTPEWEREH
ncbi:ribosome small subunit-dependent GTPase A [Corynebacterium poyangense]|uniref:Ribosome small subunit-dependent GTPase A n=1 Tax=Corynebacterium poyangense TaxID=2684405 RepID=A0A7H0SMK7_9CORY|nr:ribosome small subunit-dependent GTPase A [Corynebacterium poyangense]MBZ8176888.1 ribosome small subunit-dependent GTPase A [Corynebacterium poyangense]QNQ89782.1 ribosome small subunit-dependent GTPase A [Corynebacterium poyangense]